MMIRIKYMYWSLCRATVRHRLGNYAVTSEVCFASPFHASWAWMRSKVGQVITL